MTDALVHLNTAVLILVSAAAFILGMLATLLIFVIVRSLLGGPIRYSEARESMNLVLESERVRHTVLGWRIAQRRRSDVAWLIVDWSAEVLTDEPLYAGAIEMHAFQDGVELECPLCSDGAPDPIRLSGELRILPGTTVDLRDVFVLRNGSPVMVSFDDGETLFPLEGAGNPDRGDQASEGR